MKNFMSYYEKSYARLEEKAEKLKESLQDVQTDEQESAIHVQLNEIYSEMNILDRELWAYELYEKK